MAGSQDRVGRPPRSFREARDALGEGFRHFLHENFASPEEVATAFGVRARTAEFWWAGKHIPNGTVVGIALGLRPESAMRHLAVRIAADS